MRTSCRTAFLPILFATLLPLAMAAQDSVAGDWMVTVHEQFGPNIMRLSLVVSGEGHGVSLGTRKFEGRVKGNAIEFTFQDSKVKGALEGSELKGEVVFPDRMIKWTAIRIQPRPATPRTHDFEPQEFHRYFSSSIKPGLRIHPGDTVRTWAVDAGGRDKPGNAPSGGGNPQTGPFYVEGALPNDTLVVRLNEGPDESRLGRQRQHHHAERAGAWQPRQHQVGSRISTVAGSSMRRRTLRLSKSRPTR